MGAKIFLPCMECPLQKECKSNHTCGPYSQQCEDLRRNAVLDFALTAQEFSIVRFDAQLNMCYQSYMSKYMIQPHYVKVPGWIITAVEALGECLSTPPVVSEFGLLYKGLWLLPTVCIDNLDEIEVF